MMYEHYLKELFMNPPDRIYLVYRDEAVGLLSYDGEFYTFEYLPEYAAKGLPALPGIEESKAVSRFLWSYFLTRIPSHKSPLFQRLVDEYDLSEPEQHNWMALLATLGSKVATDPFLMKVSLED